MFASQNYITFFNNVFNKELQPNQLAKFIEKELAPVCNELKIGKISANVDLPADEFDKKHNLKNTTIYVSNYDSLANPFTTTITTFSNGSVTFFSYPLPNCSWISEEKNSIEFLHNSLYLIFSRSNMNKLLLKAKETDSLTGALNLSGIMHLGNVIFERHLISKFSVLFMNIKKFRKISDIVSSKNADLILKKYVNIITRFLDKDGSISRPGGDNFIILVKSSRISALVKLLENIRITVDVEGQKKTAIISVNIGVCQGGIETPSFDYLITNASSACKAAKASPTESLLFYKAGELEAIGPE